MLRKLLTSAIFLLVAFGAASAQNYHIRVSFNTNIREKPSLQSRIVDTVQSGTTLLVIGQQDRWLRIGPGAREAWMANWVRHTRVEQAASQVDNCCFVDRQCNTDQEWTAGYWAYQNNQCGAPVDTQTPGTKLETTAPAETDNCCFVDRLCTTDKDWSERLLGVHQNGKCPAGGAHASTAHARPTIEGPAGFVRGIVDGLNWLERRVPEWYQFVISGSNHIVPTHTYGSSFARLHDATLLIDGRAYGSRLILGMVLVHEACHIHRHRAGLQPGGKIGELACYEKEIEYLNAVDPYRRLEDTSVLIRNRQFIIATADDPYWWFNKP